MSQARQQRLRSAQAAKPKRRSMQFDFRPHTSLTIAQPAFRFVRIPRLLITRPILAMASIPPLGHGPLRSPANGWKFGGFNRIQRRTSRETSRSTFETTVATLLETTAAPHHVRVGNDSRERRRDRDRVLQMQSFHRYRKSRKIRRGWAKAQSDVPTVPPHAWTKWWHASVYALPSTPSGLRRTSRAPPGKQLSPSSLRTQGPITTGPSLWHFGGNGFPSNNKYHAVWVPAFAWTHMPFEMRAYAIRRLDVIARSASPERRRPLRADAERRKNCRGPRRGTQRSVTGTIRYGWPGHVTCLAHATESSHAAA